MLRWYRTVYNLYKQAFLGRERQISKDDPKERKRD
jgi:hypothetical protein